MIEFDANSLISGAISGVLSGLLAHNLPLRLLLRKAKSLLAYPFREISRLYGWVKREWHEEMRVRKYKHRSITFADLDPQAQANVRLTDLSPQTRAGITFSDLGNEARNRFFAEVVIPIARLAGELTANFRYHESRFDHCSASLDNGGTPAFANNSTLMRFQISLPRNVSNPIFQENMEIGGTLTGDGFYLTFAGQTGVCYSHDDRLSISDNLVEQINQMETTWSTGDAVVYTISVQLHTIGVNGMEFTYE